MTIFKLKRGLAASWAASNPVLLEGEPGGEKDTGQLKIGDGVNHWNDLPYSGSRDVSITEDTIAMLTPLRIVSQWSITAQATALAIANPVPDGFFDGQSLLIRIKDNGTPRSITWDTDYRAIGVTLPTTTVAGKILYVGAKWNAADTKFDVISVGRQA